MRLLGLTGGVGSGKSEVARLFEKLGVAHVDADILSREVYAQPEFQSVLKRAFPTLPETAGQIDRRALRTLVFSDSQAREKLESLIYPPLILRIQARLSALSGEAFVLLSLPVLFEKGGLGFSFDRVIVVLSDKEARIARVMARDGVSRAAVEEIMAAQIDPEEARARATDLILNRGNLDSLEKEVQSLWRLYGDLYATS